MEGASGVVTLKQAMASEGSGARLDVSLVGFVGDVSVLGF